MTCLIKIEVSANFKYNYLRRLAAITCPPTKAPISAFEPRLDVGQYGYAAGASGFRFNALTLEKQMPITAAQEQNDARGAVRLLAKAAKDFIGDEPVALDKEVALNNVYRLLEAYKAHAFFGLEVPAVHFPGDTAETLTLLPPVERHVRDVRDALDHALSTTFGEQSAEQALELVEHVLRAVAYPQEHEQLSGEDRGKAKRFFEELIEHLHVS